MRHFITGLIILNAVVLGLETSRRAMDVAGELLALLNSLILAVFVVEIVAKLAASARFPPGWNVFDFVIVAISLAPAAGPLAILRSLRILRVLRLLSTIKRLRMLVIADALPPGIGWTAALLLMMFYIFGVMGTELFGDAFPDWFGTLGASIYTLFQIMTLESWSMGVARPVMEQYPHAWLFFVPFILISSFMVLNLFIAIIVNATQEVHDLEQKEERDQANQRAHDERQEMLELLCAMDQRLNRLEQQKGNDSPVRALRQHRRSDFSRDPGAAGPGA